MGRHKKSSRIRLPQGATAAAAPTIAGVAAAFCLSPSASAADVPSVPAALAAPASAGATLTSQAARAATVATDDMVLAKRFAQAAATRHATVTYRVRPGDTLASIAGHFYHNPKAWPVIYWRNHAKIKWADDIYTGEQLRVPTQAGRIPRAPAHAGAPAPAPASSTPTLSMTSSGPYPGGAFGACVVARESGGNPQIMSSSGYYGLYQFSASTWAEYGGNPADFGHATVAEQNQVFANALAAGGQSNWSLYDGC